MCPCARKFANFCVSCPWVALRIASNPRQSCVVRAAQRGFSPSQRRSQGGGLASSFKYIPLCARNACQDRPRADLQKRPSMYDINYYLLVYCCWYRLYPKRRPIAVFARLVPRHGCPAPPRCHGSREAIGVRPSEVRKLITGTLPRTLLLFCARTTFRFFLSMWCPRDFLFITPRRKRIITGERRARGDFLMDFSRPSLNGFKRGWLCCVQKIPGQVMASCPKIKKNPKTHVFSVF